jgi:hypothetical protein
LFALALGACSSARYSVDPGAPTLVVPAHFAEAKSRETASGGAPASPPQPSAAKAPSHPATAASTETTTSGLVPSTAPDPTPLRMTDQVEYELELKEGKVSVVSVKPVKLAAPIVTPRRMGRYAIELSIGHELIERLRFDFPGTAADEPELGSKQPLYAPLTLGHHAIAHVTLLVPQSPRVRRAVLVDRAASTATELEWPLPDVPRASPAVAARATTAKP